MDNYSDLLSGAAAGTPNGATGEPGQVVSLQYRVYQSFLGRYFIGHTPVLCISGCQNAWGGLLNPARSGVDLFVNTFTVSNMSGTAFRSVAWLNADPNGRASYSPYVSCANTALDPVPRPKVVLASAQTQNDPFYEGTSLFTRICSPRSTVVGNYYGKIIVPPGGSFIVVLYGAGQQPIKAEVSFGWWEKGSGKGD